MKLTVESLAPNIWCLAFLYHFNHLFYLKYFKNILCNKLVYYIYFKKYFEKNQNQMAKIDVEKVKRQIFRKLESS
jgi:hypothetical protein